MKFILWFGKLFLDFILYFFLENYDLSDQNKVS